MAGRGVLDTLSISPNPRIYRMDENNQWVLAKEPVVSAKGLNDKGDHLHFDIPSANELRKRYADTMFILQRQRK